MATITVRIGWTEAARYTDPELRAWLREQGLDVRHLTCRRDDAARAWVYEAPNLEAVE